MREVVYRRYSRLINENNPLPDLIITDGGIGQMEIVRQVLEELNIQIAVAGLAKDQKHKTNELLFGFPPKEVGMKPTETMFKFLASIQEEVHRFAITFHRDKRSKQQTGSELDQISGVGDKSKILLINHFKSIKRLRMAEKDEIEKIIGKHRSTIIYDYFHPDLKA